MGQRINIQYSVEIDDLHKEVDRLLAGVSDSIDVIQVDARAIARAGRKRDDGLACDTSLGANTMSLKTIENVDLLRRELAKIDHTLRDISTIVSGYVAYHAELSMQKTMPATEPQNQEVMDEISAQEQD